MNVIVIMIDSLNREYLSVYGMNDIQTPNFERLAKHCVTMDNHWTSSLPTMPCRHEVMAGRHEYLWRGWGSLEPYDVTLAQLCGQKNLVSMLITDTYHYFAEGSGNYHTDFSGWEFYRGHERDNWVTDPVETLPIYRQMLEEKGDRARAFMQNTYRFRDERHFFSPRLLSTAADWLDNNHAHKNFFLMVDSFDVHEPFYVPAPFDTMYDPEFQGEWPIWNNYGPASRYSPEVVRHIRAQYMGKITMFDKYLGAVLDRLDRFNLWNNSLVLVTSDHGHHLGEHGILGKNLPPYFDILTHIPLFVSFPGMKPTPGSRSKLLTSQIDVYPTVAQALGVQIPKDYTIHGFSMMPALKGQTAKIRDIAHTGYFGSSMVATDGRYTLHKYPNEKNQPLYTYGINLEQFHKRFKDPYVKAEAGRFLPYTDCIVFRVKEEQPPALGKTSTAVQGKKPDLLFDLKQGDDIDKNIHAQSPKVAARLTKLLIADLERIEAPAEQFERLGLK
ncbi:MAG: sulfatase [Candidatus Sumerlaeota bacterium]|nr:sulfatase [Candidatus Sumerlaeota bacterium]